MKNYITICVAVVSLIFLGSSGNSGGSAQRTAVFVEDLLSQMTLEEKVGQMTQVTLEVVSVPGRQEDEELVLDMDKLREAILKYKVGSILNTGGAANSVESWHAIITAIQDVATKESRLKIPVLYGIDAIHGANYTIGSTLFPQNFAMAATRSRELVRKSAEVTTVEILASGIPWNFNPVLGLGRHPYWPRFWETFGEDVYLAGQLGEEYVLGTQQNPDGSSSGVAACVKHYLGYSFPFNGQDRTPAWIPERFMRDIFLPPFAQGIKAGAKTVMVNSGEINGIPSHSDHYLLTEIMKEELGFEGFIVSDWEDVKRLYDRDRVADSPEEAVRIAVMAGIDMSMVPMDYSFAEILVKLVNEGKVPEERIDDAVRRILKVKHEVGLFENAYPQEGYKEQFASAQFTQLNLESAQEAITLLKNENDILPLGDDVRKVLVTGPTANLMSAMNGGWTLTWQGNNEALYPKEKNTFLEAVQEKLGEENVEYAEGTTFDAEVDIAEAVKKAETADVIFACLGESAYCETPGNITDLSLEDAQLQLVNQLAETGKPIVLVLYEGRPRIINKIVDKVDAILMGYLPGIEGGDATVDIAWGEVNPSGKLPFTYPKSPGGLTPYDYKPLEFFDVNSYDPEYPFGYGLSYTTFEYSDLIMKKEFAQDEEITVSVKVKNTGEREGKEAVELYLTDMYGSVSRPNKQLQGFEKITLKPGEVKTIEFVIKPGQLAFHNRENKKVVEPGEFKVGIANLEETFVLK